MTEHYGFVVVGGGMAGGRAAYALAAAAKNTVALVGDERHLPFDRPQLSKACLITGEPPDPWLPSGGSSPVTVLGTGANSLDTEARKLTLSDGRTITYRHLLIATGLRPRQLGGPARPAHPGTGVYYLRTLDDALALRERLVGAKRLALVGGGFISLEVASAAIKLGLSVDVIERQPLLLLSLGEEVARRVAAYAAEQGVRFHTSTTVEGFFYDQAGQFVGLRTSRDDIPADLAVAGIGGIPNTEWLAGSGIEARDGIVVDEFCRTSVSGVWAAGDVARYPYPQAGTVRVEHESHAQSQALTAARNMLGRPTPYRNVPFAWSENFGHYLWSVGLSQQANDTLTVDGLGGAQFVTAHLRDGMLVAVTGLDGRKLIATARQLVARNTSVGSARTFTGHLAS